MRNDYLFLHRKKINQIQKRWLLLTKNQLYNNSLWFLAGLMLVVGDSKLVIATGLAVGAMSTIYTGNNFDYKTYLFQLRKSLTGVNRQLALAVGGGSVVAIASYLCLNIWAEIDNHWLATAIITQGLVSTSALSLLAWYFLKKQLFIASNTSIKSFEKLVSNLTADSKIKRLLTVNQLMELWVNQQLTIEETRQLQNYLYLLQQSETDQIIQQKITESLSKLSFAQEMNVNQPLNIPSSTSQKIHFKVQQRKVQQIKA